MDMDKNGTRFRKWHLPLLVLLVIGSVYAIRNNTKGAATKAAYISDEGVAFGTVYHVKYLHDEDLHTEIESVLCGVDSSLSMFNPQSVLSRINRNETDSVDGKLSEVLRLSMEVYGETDGAFDVTVAPLVNAWGFGFRQGDFPDSASVDSMMLLVGTDRLRLSGMVIRKERPGMVLDLSAVAKGYAVDLVSEMLEGRGIGDYMVEIGGEVRTSGRNPKGEPWRIGINKPDDDSTCVRNDLQAVLAVDTACMATSGNYRNFYVRDGRKIAHTIDPRTGYPVQHSILSSTVMASSTAEADAYATAFMVLGLDGARALLARHGGLEAYFIYADEDGEYRTWCTEGFGKLIAE